MVLGYRQIQQLCIGYIVAWMISPPLAYDMIYRLLAVGAALVWFLLQSASREIDDIDYRMVNPLSTFLICAFAYGIALLFFGIIFKGESIFGAFYNNITTYVLLFVGYVGGVYCKTGRYKELKKLFVFTAILVVLFSITSIARSDEFYFMTRSAGGEVSDDYNLLARSAAMHGVGAFGFFAFGGAFAPLLLWISYSYKGWKRVICIVAFIIVEVGVISAGYTLALLISFVGISFTVLIKVESFGIKALFFIGAVFLLMFWKDFSAMLYSFLQRIASGTMYANKVEDIFSFLIGGNSTGTFQARQERYVLSLTSIFKYPILGSYILNNTNSIGSHSSILDPYAAYGWGIGAAWTYIIVLFPQKMSRIAEDRKLGVLISVVLFLTALFNRTTMIMGVFFLIAPAIGYIEKVDNELMYEYGEDL